MPPIPVKACVFDAYGTLFDFASAAAGCQDVLGDKTAAVTALWRDKQMQYTWLRAVQGRHADFWQVTGDALDFTLETLALADPALRERLMGLYRTLDSFPEVPDVLRTLKARGYQTAILSNGSPAMLAERRRGRGPRRPARPRRLGRGGRRLQAPSERLPALRRPAGRAGGSHRFPVLERLGCLCRLRLRHARRLVQPLRPAPRAAARHARCRDAHARRAAGPDRPGVKTGGQAPCRLRRPPGRSRMRPAAILHSQPLLFCRRGTTFRL